MAGLFQVLWGQQDGTFKKAETLNGTNDEPLVIPIEDDQFSLETICTRPTAADWDSDGDLDLIVGNFSGSFYVFTGQGEGRFEPAPQPVMTGDVPLKIDGHHSDPFVVDWDLDGDIDLLSGSSNGGVQWAENRAGAGKSPELQPFQTLIEPGTRIESGRSLAEADLRGPLSSTRVWVDDINSDGKLDILVGDTVTLISPAEGLSEEEMQNEYENWQESIKVASEEAYSSTAEEKQRDEAQERLRDLYKKRSDFMIEDRTGFVWLYLRK
jgi:hypothetical protein